MRGHQVTGRTIEPAPIEHSAQRVDIGVHHIDTEEMHERMADERHSDHYDSNSHKDAGGSNNVAATGGQLDRQGQCRGCGDGQGQEQKSSPMEEGDISSQHGKRHTCDQAE